MKNDGILHEATKEIEFATRLASLKIWGCIEVEKFLQENHPPSLHISMINLTHLIHDTLILLEWMDFKRDSKVNLKIDHRLSLMFSDHDSIVFLLIQLIQTSIEDPLRDSEIQLEARGFYNDDFSESNEDEGSSIQ